MAIAEAAPARAARSSRSPRQLRTLRKIALGVAGIVGFLLTWQLLPTLGVVDPRYFPTATTTLAELGQLMRDLEFWRNVGRTMTAWGIGLVIATVLATVLGTIIGLAPFLRRATHTTVEFLRPIPSVALIPLAVLLFGVKIEASLMLIVYACFWQIFIQTLYGVGDVDPVAISTGRSYGFTRWQRTRQIVFPTALPYLMTGLRLSAAVALILAVTAQLLIGIPGIGQEISRAQSNGQYVTMYALILATGLLGVCINLGARLLERRVLSWHESVRGELAS